MLLKHRVVILSYLLGKLWQWFWVAIILLPIGVILSSYQDIDQELWAHLLEFRMLTLLSNTFILLIGVGIGTLILGTTSAWLTAIYRFPGQKIFFWALMLPLGIPAYVMAFSQVGLFEYSGPMSTYLRNSWGLSKGLPDIRNAAGVVMVMSLAFYPYVYLLARNAFSSMGKRSLEVGASLGLNPVQAFFKIALPMARPWIAGGTLLALMETLADFGTVSIFNFDTFTTAIYQAWYSFFSIETAKQLASIMIIIVFALLLIEQYSRKQKRFTQLGKSQQELRIQLKGWQAIFATFYCCIILIMAFILPVGQLIVWAYQTWGNAFDVNLWSYAMHSLVIALLAAFFVMISALGLALSKRFIKTNQSIWLTKIATLGYGIPGTILAVGIFVPVAWLDNQLIELFGLSESSMGWIKGTLGVLILAYAVRFMAIAFSSIESGLERISPQQEEAARSLGKTGASLVTAIHLPLLKGALSIAMLMVFVDVMKEMPIMLMIRPFGWDTLAVRIFNFTTEGQYSLAAWPSLLIVLTGLIPVLLFSRQEKRV